MSKTGRPAPPNIEPGMKECRRCHAVLLIDKFSRDRSSKDGHVLYCKPCCSKMKAASQQRGSLKGTFARGYFPRLGASPKEADNTRKIIEQEFEMFRAAGWSEKYIRKMYPKKFLDKIGARF